VSVLGESSGWKKRIRRRRSPKDVKPSFAIEGTKFAKGGEKGEKE